MAVVATLPQELKPMSSIISAAPVKADVMRPQSDRPTTVVGNTKDAGRVKIGGSSIRFATAHANTKDKGRVHIGGSSIRY